MASPQTPEILFAHPSLRPEGLKHCTIEQMRDVYQMQQELSAFGMGKNTFNTQQLSIVEAYERMIVYKIPEQMHKCLQKAANGTLKGLNIAEYCKDSRGVAVEPDIAVRKIEKGVKKVFNALQVEGIRENLVQFRDWTKSQNMDSRVSKLFTDIHNLLETCYEFHDDVGGVQCTDNVFKGIRKSIHTYQSFEKISQKPPITPVFDFDSNPFLHSTSKVSPRFVQKQNELKELLEKLKAENAKSIQEDSESPAKKPKPDDTLKPKGGQGGRVGSTPAPSKGKGRAPDVGKPRPQEQEDMGTTDDEVDDNVGPALPEKKDGTPPAPVAAADDNTPAPVAATGKKHKAPYSAESASAPFSLKPVSK